MDWRKKARRVWHFLWHEESVWSWIANIIIAFVMIKFVLYPLAGLLMGTSLPVVAVVSSSMDHRVVGGVICGEPHEKGTAFWDACGEWYEERGISEEEFRSFPFKKGFWKGDVMILFGSNPANTEVGDVIVFLSRKQYPIIHRVTDKHETEGTTYYATKGDHNEVSIQEYALWDGRNYYSCYVENAGALYPSICGPGTPRVSPETPGAVAVLDETRVSEEQVIGRAVGRIPLIGWVKIIFVDLVNLFIR